MTARTVDVRDYACSSVTLVLWYLFVVFLELVSLFNFTCRIMRKL